MIWLRVGTDGGLCGSEIPSYKLKKKWEDFFSSIGPVSFSGRILPQQRYGNPNENHTKY